MTDCNKSLELNPEDPNTLDSRGLVYLKSGQLDLAIKDYSAALEVEPRMYGSRYGRGLARIRLGDLPGGYDDIARAKERRPKVEADFRRYGVI